MEALDGVGRSLIAFNAFDLRSLGQNIASHTLPKNTKKLSGPQSLTMETLSFALPPPPHFFIISFRCVCCFFFLLLLLSSLAALKPR